MENIIIVAIIIAIVSPVSLFIYKSKKKGRHCIGCPYADQCSKKK